LAAACRVGSERSEGRIESPARHPFGEEPPRTRGAPALSPRELAHRQPGHRERNERRDERFAVRLHAGEAAGNVEILVRREIVLERGRVPDIDELARILFGKLSYWRAAPAHFALRGRQEAAENAQQ